MLAGARGIKNGAFTVKTHRMFFFHITHEKCENAPITRWLRICVWVNLGRPGSFVFKILSVSNVPRRLRFQISTGLFGNALQAGGMNLKTALGFVVDGKPRGDSHMEQTGTLVGNFEFNPSRRPSGRGSSFLWPLKEANLGVAWANFDP